MSGFERLFWIFNLSEHCSITVHTFFVVQEVIIQSISGMASKLCLSTAFVTPYNKTLYLHLKIEYMLRILAFSRYKTHRHKTSACSDFCINQILES